MHACPELVRDGYDAADWTAGDRRDLPAEGMCGDTQTGVIGTPSHASAAKGKVLTENLVTAFSRVYDLMRTSQPQQ